MNLYQEKKLLLLAHFNETCVVPEILQTFGGRGKLFLRGGLQEHSVRKYFGKKLKNLG